MAWKYVVALVRSGGVQMEMPFIFPELIVHGMLSQVLEPLLRAHKLEFVQVVSAGSIVFENAECYGESETLQIQSRPNEDTSLVLLYDYTKGIRDSMPQETIDMLTKMIKEHKA